DRLHDLAVPSLTIAGEEDAMYPLAQQRAAAARAPGGRFETVPGKHISVIEQPAQVAELITRIAKDLPT
ncbi:MAG: alpha/beta hydrolase, partial [Pseudomonadota bacterium]